MKRMTGALFTFFLVSPTCSACGCFEADEGGCQTDTPGVMGNAIFDFMHTDDNVAEDSGNAFCADTRAHMTIRPVDSEDAMPPWSIESSDEHVITVDEVLEGESFPVVLGMNDPGTAQLSVIDNRNDEIFDYVDIAVAEPRGMESLMAFLLLDWAPAGDTILVPEGTGNCYLAFYPFDAAGGEERYLFGEYDITVAADEASFEIEHFSHAYCGEHPFTEEGMWFCSGGDTGKYYIIRISALAGGSRSIDFTGPRSLQISKQFTTVDPDAVDELDITVVPLSGTFEGRYVGEVGIMAAVQKSSGTMLCGSYPVLFESSNASVVSLRDSPYLESNEIEFYLNSPGTAAVRAFLVDNPSLETVFTFDVSRAP